MQEVFSKFRFTATIYFGSVLQLREMEAQSFEARSCTLLFATGEPAQCRCCNVLFRDAS